MWCGGWWRGRRMSELAQQKNTESSSSSPPGEERCSDRPFEDPQTLWSRKDICYKWGWWQFSFFGTFCYSWLRWKLNLNNSIWQFGFKKNAQTWSSYALIRNFRTDAASVNSRVDNPGFTSCHLAERRERQVESPAGGCCHAMFSCLTWEERVNQWLPPCYAYGALWYWFHRGVGVPWGLYNHTEDTQNTLPARKCCNENIAIWVFVQQI